MSPEREPEVLRKRRRERRGTGAFWGDAGEAASLGRSGRFSSAASAGSRSAAWTAPLRSAAGELGGGLGATVLEGVRSPVLLLALLAAAAIGGGYALVASWKAMQDAPLKAAGLRPQAAPPASPPSAMARAKGSFARSLDLVAGANQGALGDGDDEGPAPERPVAPAPPPPPPARSAAEPDGAPAGEQAGSGGGEGPGELSRVSLPPAASTISFLPVAPQASAGSPRPPSGGAARAAAARERRRSPGSRTVRGSAPGSRSALSQLRAAERLSRSAAQAPPEAARFEAAKAFDGAGPVAGGQTIGGGGASQPSGPDVGGGRPLASGNRTSPSGGDRSGAGPDDPGDCRLAANQGSELCRELETKDVPSPAEGLLAKAHRLFLAIVAALTLAFVLRRASAPWALAASRLVAALAAAASGVLAAIGAYAMLRSEASSGLPWVLAGGVLLLASLRLARGTGGGDPLGVKADVNRTLEPAAQEAHARLEPRLAL